MKSESDLSEHDVETLLNEARDGVHQDPRTAEALARLGQAVAAEHDWPHLSALAGYLLAQIHTERGEFEAGLTLIAAARRSWLEAGQVVAALRTHLGRMQILDDLGRHTEALTVGQQLLAALDDTATDVDTELIRAIRAHTINNLGTAYGYLGEHGRALASYAEAEAEYRALAEACRPLANRGVELLALGRAREARTDLTAAVEGFRAAGDEVFAAKCAGFLALAPQQLGELFEALEVLTRARRTLEELGAAPEAVRLQLAVAETYGHGTFVSGLVSPLAPGATIVPMRVLDSDGTGNEIVIAQAIRDAVASQANVINLSFGTNSTGGYKPLPGRQRGRPRGTAVGAGTTQIASYASRGPWVELAAPATDVIGPEHRHRERPVRPGRCGQEPGQGALTGPKRPRPPLSKSEVHPTFAH